MQSAAGVTHVNHDVIALTTKATELFLMDFARRAYDLQDGEDKSNSLEYEDVRRLVHTDPRYEFLRDTTPAKIRFEDALKLVEANKRKKDDVRLEKQNVNNGNDQQNTKNQEEEELDDD